MGWLRRPDKDLINLRGAVLTNSHNSDLALNGKKMKFQNEKGPASCRALWFSRYIFD